MSQKRALAKKTTLVVSPRKRVGSGDETTTRLLKGRSTQRVWCGACAVCCHPETKSKVLQKKINK